MQPEPTHGARQVFGPVVAGGADLVREVDALDARGGDAPRVREQL
jgi:hypothetical protein